MASIGVFPSILGRPWKVSAGSGKEKGPRGPRLCTRRSVRYVYRAGGEPITSRVDALPRHWGFLPESLWKKAITVSQARRQRQPSGRFDPCRGRRWGGSLGGGGRGRMAVSFQISATTRTRTSFDIEGARGQRVNWWATRSSGACAQRRVSPLKVLDGVFEGGSCRRSGREASACRGRSWREVRGRASAQSGAGFIEAWRHHGAWTRPLMRS